MSEATSGIEIASESRVTAVEIQVLAIGDRRIEKRGTEYR
jgi:hypothetical protein